MYNEGKSEVQLQREIELIINCFKQVGIIMENEIKKPRNGEYSAIIGNGGELLEVDLKNDL